MVLVDRTPETAPLEAGMRLAGAGTALAEGVDPAEAIAGGLQAARERGPGRPWLAERNDDAAAVLLDWVSSSTP
jgi:hypothetical protein